MVNPISFKLDLKTGNHGFAEVQPDPRIENIEVRDGSDAEIKSVGQVIKRTDKPGWWRVMSINRPRYGLMKVSRRERRK